MYLISLYFDEGTNKKIQLYMEQIAQRTGNMAMIDGKVPPHITLSAFDMAEEEKAIAGFTAMEQEFEKGQIFWCSVGMFLPHTIYLSPVLNAYLQKLSDRSLHPHPAPLRGGGGLQDRGLCPAEKLQPGGGTDPEQIPAVFLVSAYNTGKKTESGGNAGGICCDAEPVCTVYR